MAISQLAVLRLYNVVIEDVIAGVRETFLDDGVDEQVLQELKQLWETKLLASKAVEQASDMPEHHPPPIVANNMKANGAIKKNTGFEQSSSNQTASNQQASNTNSVPNQSQSGSTNSTPQTTNIANLDPHSKVPVQLTLPAQTGVPGSTQRVFTLHIPAAALHNNQLHQILTGPIITATMNLPQNLAATLLQQHINAALLGQQSSFTTTPATSVAKSQLDGGGYDSSDDDSETGGAGASDDDADGAGSGLGSDGGVDDEDAEDGDEGGAEEEPLNSGDDVSEEDPTDLFDTDNVVVCQYDKITRSRNKWKFYLKDGIMNLSGKDFIFQKANGDAEW